MRLITRGQWGARYGDGAGERPLPATEAYLHHTVTVAPDLEWVDADGDHVDDDEERAMRTIEGIGADRFGTAYGFPYTAAFMPRGGAAYLGHDVSQMGAHTYGHNDTAVGFALVGNYEKNKPTDAQLDAVAWALTEFKRRGWLKSARLTGGHRDVKATACPGRYAYAAIPEINRRAAAIENGDDMATAKEIVDELLARNVGYYHYDKDRKKPIDVKAALGAGARYSFWALSTLNALTPLIEAAAAGDALSAEQVKTIADAAAAAVPEDLAADVVDELAGRIGATS